MNATAEGGRLSFQFTITNAGTYTVNTIVSAPNSGSDSFFVNIDSEPGDANVWHIPNTVGFEIRGVRFVGETNDHAFALTAMSHVLIFRGREANCALDRVTIVPVTNAVPPQPIPGPPPAPTNLRIQAVGQNRLDLGWSSVTNAATEVERRVETDPFIRVAVVSPGTMHYSDTNVRRHRNYAYRCRSTNTEGTSPFSNTVLFSSR